VWLAVSYCLTCCFQNSTTSIAPLLVVENFSGFYSQPDRQPAKTQGLIKVVFLFKLFFVTNIIPYFVTCQIK
jgi:hypothetical protein